MIRYALRCTKGHEFDSWFQSAAAFGRLEAAGRLNCATCGSSEVAKALMTPTVHAPRTGAAAADDRPLAAPRDDFERKLAAIRRHVEENADYVGVNFVTEVRDMHEGRTVARSIWGEAKLDEARALVEEGIPVAPLPFRPTRSNN